MSQSTVSSEASGGISYCQAPIGSLRAQNPSA